MPETMEIEIYKDGSVQVHIKGTTGKKCENVEKAIAEAIGRVKKSERTKEYYDQPVLTASTVSH